MKKLIVLSAIAISFACVWGVFSSCTPQTVYNSTSSSGKSQSASTGNSTTGNSPSDTAQSNSTSTDSSTQTCVHQFGEWHVVKAATTEETGLEERICSVCGEAETREIEKLLPEVETQVTLHKNMKVLQAKLCVGGYEWGPAIDALAFEVDGVVTEEDVVAKKFTVTFNNVKIPVVAAYPCNENGEMVYRNSQYFAVKFAAKYGRLNPFTGGTLSTWRTDNVTVCVGLNNNSTLSVHKNGICTTYTKFNFDDPLPIADRLSPSTVNFRKSAYTDEEKKIKLTYAAYETDELRTDGKKDPLIIWLHGAGEGGTDTDIALLGNDVTNLSEKKIQNYFGGAYVLAVQTPTMWMNDGSGSYTSDGYSVYIEPLMKAIRYYAETENTDVDLSKIYVGGCSNGGFMTVSLMIHYGDYFAAAYPVCEAYKDEWIDQRTIEQLSKYNIWFTQAANDTVVSPAAYTQATYIRLLQAGAKNVYFSYFKTVQGQDDNVSYIGHFSWLYVLSDRCIGVQSTNMTTADEFAPDNETGGGRENVLVAGEKVTLWGWLASKQK